MFFSKTACIFAQNLIILGYNQLNLNLFLIYGSITKLNFKGYMAIPTDQKTLPIDRVVRQKPDNLQG